MMHNLSSPFLQNGLKAKLEQFSIKLPWIERLDFTSEPAPLAPELSAEVSHLLFCFIFTLFLLMFIFPPACLCDDPDM